MHEPPPPPPPAEPPSLPEPVPAPVPPAPAAPVIDQAARELRAKQAEMRIAELEPLQQAILKRMNDILTPDQRKSRLQASKAARDAGKTGVELQQIINNAMHLNAEQAAQWAIAKKDLQAVRSDIAKEVAHLLTDDQKKAVEAE